MSCTRIIIVLALCSVLGVCKPRRADMGLFETSIDSDKGKLAALSSYRAFSQQFGIHITKHPIYEDVRKIFGDVKDRMDEVGYYIKLKSLAFYLGEMNKKDLLEIQTDTTKIDYLSLVKDISLSEKIAIQCNSLLGHKKTSFSLCYDYRSCETVLEVLNEFSLAANNIYNFDLGAIKRAEEQNTPKPQEAYRILQSKMMDARIDISCLPVTLKNVSLGYRMDSLLVKLDFQRALKKDFGKRPMWDLASFGPDAKSEANRNNLRKHLDDIRNRLKDLITHAEQSYLQEGDPALVTNRLAHNLIEDEIIRPRFNLAPLFRNDPANSMTEDFYTPVKAQVYDYFKKDLSGQDVDKTKEVSKIILPDDKQRDALQMQLDQLASEITASHSNNYAMLNYLDRPDRNDILPWLDTLKQKVIAWNNWYPNFAVSGEARPKNIEHISPYLGFLMLLTFVEDEMTLPFRHEYLETMQWMARNISENIDLTADLSRIRKIEAQNSINYYMNMVKSMDAQIQRQAQEVGLDKEGKVVDQDIAFAFTNLKFREKDLTRKFPEDFHSLLDEFANYQSAKVKYALAIQAFNEQFDKADEKLLGPDLVVAGGGATISNDEKKNYEKATQNLSKEQNTYKREAIRLNCLNYAGGQKRIEFFNTGLEKDLIACWQPWFKWWHNKGAFDMTHGLTGELDLSKICGFRVSSQGEPLPPFSIAQINKQVDDSIRNKELTDECNKATQQFKATLVQTAISSATMPLMGGLGSVPSRIILSRLAQASLFRLGAQQIEGLAMRRLLGTALIRHQAAYWGLTLGRTVGVVGLNSFVTSVAFDLANSIMFAPFGAKVFDPSKSVEQNVGDWFKRVMVSTLVFSLMHPMHILSNGAAVNIIARVPMPNILQHAVAAGIPFIATTAFFTESFRIHEGIDYLLGHEEHIDHGTFFERIASATVMTAAFGLLGRFSHHLSGEQAPPNQRQALLEQAKMARQLRDIRLGPFRTEYLANFKLDKTVQTFFDEQGVFQYRELPVLKNKDGSIAVPLIGDNFPVDPYALLGITNPYLRGAKFRKLLNDQVAIRTKEYSDLINNPKVDDETRSLAFYHLRMVDASYNALRNPKTRAFMDKVLHEGYAYDFSAPQARRPAWDGPRNLLDYQQIIEKVKSAPNIDKYNDSNYDQAL